MIEHLIDKNFKFLILPIVTTIFTIWIKYLCRKKKNISFKKEDFFVGLNIYIVSLVILLNNVLYQYYQYVTGSQYNLECFYYIFDTLKLMGFNLFVLMGIVIIIRNYGWKKKDELNLILGIIIPILFGFVSLCYSVFWIKEL